MCHNHGIRSCCDAVEAGLRCSDVPESVPMPGHDAADRKARAVGATRGEARSEPDRGCLSDFSVKHREHLAPSSRPTSAAGRKSASLRHSVTADLHCFIFGSIQRPRLFDDLVCGVHQRPAPRPITLSSACACDLKRAYCTVCHPGYMGMCRR